MSPFAPPFAPLLCPLRPPPFPSRAWATSAFVLARQPAQPRGQSLQHAEQLAEVLYRLSDLGRAAGETGAGRRPASGQVQGEGFAQSRFPELH